MTCQMTERVTMRLSFDSLPEAGRNSLSGVHRAHAKGEPWRVSTRYLH